MLELNWLSVLLTMLGSSTLDEMGSREEVKLPIVESEAVVWGGERVCIYLIFFTTVFTM